MFEKIRVALNEVIEISNECPQELRLKCFEILLDALVKTEFSTSTVIPSTPAKSPEVEPQFFAQYEITKTEWGRIFHFDGKSYTIIAKDLKESTKAGQQIKLALLLGVKGLLESNESTIFKGELMEICKKYSAYDQANFAGHMKKQKHFFITKGKDSWGLTIPGQERAVEVIKELVQ